MARGEARTDTGFDEGEHEPMLVRANSAEGQVRRGAEHVRGNGSAAARAGEKRRRERIAVSLPVHARPFDSRFAEIEDVGEVENFTRDGLLFASFMPHYFVGMRLVVTFPFGERVSAHRKFLGVVARLEERPRGMTGVAVRFLL